jgi:SdpI/YfhL protein family
VAVVLRIVFLIVLVVLGSALTVVGVLGWRERLSMDGRLGVRTPAALRSPEAFRLANRVAGLPVLVAGAISVLGGLAAFATGDIVIAVIALVGPLLLARAGGVAGDRAAVTLPARTASRPTACAGCACGNCG